MDKDFWDRLQRAIKTAQRAKAHAAVSEYVPPAAGMARARLVGYFELGKHEEENMQGKKVLRDKVDLVFELSGPNHPPREVGDALIPHRITVQETLSYGQYANFSRLFATMNEVHGGFATHMAELLVRPFVVQVFHRRSRDGTKVYAGLKGPNGYNVRGVTYQNAETGETKTVEVTPLLTQPRYFIWDAADKEMWDSIYIPGVYEERRNEKGALVAPARSKNVLQERIMSAANWPELAERMGISPAS